MDQREHQRGHGQLQPLGGGVWDDGANYGVAQVPDAQRTESPVSIQSKLWRLRIDVSN